MSAVDKADFYTKYSFIKRPSKTLGRGDMALYREII